jgi:hypothetical protein
MHLLYLRYLASAVFRQQSFDSEFSLEIFREEFGV